MERQKVLFIGGLGRSGSTLVEKLLNEQPGMVSAGETIHLWERGLRDQERCGCGEAFGSCPHWAAIGQSGFGGWEYVDVDEAIDLRWSVDRSRRLPQIFSSLVNNRLAPEQARYLKYLVPVLHSVGAHNPALGTAPSDNGNEPTAKHRPVVIESSKHLSTAALLALDPSLDVRVLHLIRDPRGVAYSWTKEVARPETDDENMPTYHPLRTAGRWVTDNLGFEALGRFVPMQRLRYEDFLTDPTGHLRSISTFAGVDEASINLDFLVDNTATLTAPMHSVAGNPMRFGRSTITLKLDDEWKTNLDPKQARLVAAATAPLLARYGYPITTELYNPAVPSNQLENGEHQSVAPPAIT